MLEQMLANAPVLRFDRQHVSFSATSEAPPHVVSLPGVTVKLRANFCIPPCCVTDEEFHCSRCICAEAQVPSSLGPSVQQKNCPMEMELPSCCCTPLLRQTKMTVKFIITKRHNLKLIPEC